MKITVPKPKYLFLLTAMALLALSPALALANHHACPGSKNAHSLKAKPAGIHTLECGLRIGRLTSTSPWRSTPKKNPELMDSTQKVFKAKALLASAKQFNSPIASLPFSPHNFLVLRI